MLSQRDHIRRMTELGDLLRLLRSKRICRSEVDVVSEDGIRGVLSFRVGIGTVSGVTEDPRVRDITRSGSPHGAGLARARP